MTLTHALQKEIACFNHCVVTLVADKGKDSGYALIAKDLADIVTTERDHTCMHQRACNKTMILQI